MLGWLRLGDLLDPPALIQGDLEPVPYLSLGFWLDRTKGAGEGNRTLMTSLEGWGSAIELRPRSGHTGVIGRRPLSR
jgi:hypothetical protein